MSESNRSQLVGSKAEKAKERAKSGTSRLSFPKKCLFAFSILCGLSVLLSIILEIGLRLFMPQVLLPRYVTDSGFGIRCHSASISTWHTTQDYRISVRTNSVGMRSDREYTLSKGKDIIRIVGLGDSFTFGYGVDVRDTYLAILERLLRDRGLNVEVINLGVAGFGTAEELVMLNKMALDYNPDIVIVGYYTNDIADNTRAGLYRLNSDGDLETFRDEYLPGIRIRDVLYSFSLYRYLAENSHLLYWARSTASSILQKRLRKANLSEQKADEGVELHLTASLLDGIYDTCNLNAIRFCLLDIPAAYDLDGNLPIEYLRKVPQSSIVKVDEQIARQMTARKIYWTESDGHWTPFGHELAAAALADWVQADLARSSGRP